MKFLTYNCLIFLLLTQFLDAQIKPISKTTEGNFIVFKTNLYDENLDALNNQTYELKRKISDANTEAIYRDSYGFSKNSFEKTFSESSYNFLRNNRNKQNTFSVKYIIDHTGNNVMSCALYFPVTSIELSDNEVEAILLEAISHRFDYTNKPIENNSFYFLANYNFVL